MAITYKILGQSSPVANTLTTLYAVPIGYSAATSTLSICNQNAADATYRIAVRQANATIDFKHYVAYDTPVFGYDTVSLTIAMTLDTYDVVSVSSNLTNVSFSLFGSEINS